MGGQPCICLNFHGIGTPRRSLEPGEDRYWISEAFFWQVLDTICAQPSAERIRLTFDDGNVSDHDIALPALIARGLVADFFVMTGRIGQSGSLNQAQIYALQAAGMGIGSHGIAHLNWTCLSAEALRNELVVSRQVLEDLCAMPVHMAGISFGAYDGRVLRAIRAADYTAAFSSDGGSMRTNAFLRPRTSLYADMTMQMVRDTLANRASPARRLRRRLAMMRKRLF